MATVIRNLFILFLVVLFLSIGLSAYYIENRLPEKSYNALLQKIADGEIRSLDVTGSEVEIRTTSGTPFRVVLPDNYSWKASEVDLKSTNIYFHTDYSSYFLTGG